jgi:hypothetical protein
MVNYKDALYLFGGYSGIEREINLIQNEVYKLEFENGTPVRWVIFSEPNEIIPSIFEYHSSSVHMNQMVRRRRLNVDYLGRIHLWNLF